MGENNIIRIVKKISKKYIKELDNLIFPTLSNGNVELNCIIGNIFALDSALMGCLDKSYIEEKDWKILDESYEYVKNYNYVDLKTRYSEVTSLNDSLIYLNKLKEIYNYFLSLKEKK